MKQLALDIMALREVITYDPELGVFRWRHSRGRMTSGSIAGNINHDGYRVIGVNRYIYMASHLAWLYMTGKWPENEIDHVNGEPGDNRWSNLREATSTENNRNRNGHRDSKSGVKGVDWHCGKWRAAICTNRKWQQIGRYDTLEEASMAYREAAKSQHGSFARV